MKFLARTGLATACLGLLASSASAQEQPKRAENTVYAEGLGAGLLYSINYERMVTDDLGVRAGFGYWSVSASATSGNSTAESKASYLTIPVTVSWLGIRGRRSALELGGGATLAYASGSASTIGSKASGSGVQPFVVAMIGYRLHPVEGSGFNFRVGLMALGGKGVTFSDDTTKVDKFGFIPWGYISFGASF